MSERYCNVDQRPAPCLPILPDTQPEIKSQYLTPVDRSHPTTRHTTSGAIDQSNIEESPPSYDYIEESSIEAVQSQHSGSRECYTRLQNTTHDQQVPLTQALLPREMEGRNQVGKPVWMKKWCWVCSLITIVFLLLVIIGGIIFYLKSGNVPPSRGTFLLQINLTTGAGGNTGIDDLSWTPEGDIMVARWSGKQLWRVRVDPRSLTVTYRELLYKDESFNSVSCGMDGTWGAVANRDHIKLHQPGSQSEVWRPAEVPDPAKILMMKDEMWVSPNHPGPVYVYGRDRVLRRTIAVDNKYTLQCITVSDGRLIATTGNNGYLLHILTLRDGSLVTVGGKGTEGGKFNMPVGVATDPTGPILVCDSYNKRVSVFTPTGVFLHQLDLGDLTKTWSIAVMARTGKKPLLALSASGEIRVYELE